MKRFFSLVLLAVLLLSVTAAVIPAQGLSVTSIKRNGRNTVTDDGVRYIYNLLEAEMEKPEPSASIELDRALRISAEQLNKAYTLFISDYPECFWLSNSFTYSHINGELVSFRPSYSFTGDELIIAKREFNKAVLEILNDVPNTDNYSKALYIHDALAKRVSYEMVGHHQTAYGALVDGKAVCAGYAAAYQALLNLVGISAWTVTGVATNGNEPPVEHAWNVVWLDEETCVYTDVTWNDNDSALYHYYFNMSKDEISVDHIVSSELFALPSCTHYDQSYFDLHGNTVDDSTTISQLAALFGEAKGGERHATVCYEGNDVESFLDKIAESQSELYDALECQSGPRSYRMSMLGDELHITVAASFLENTYPVRINAPATLTTYDESTQYVAVGTPMKAVTYAPQKGYYFPADYSAQEVNGVKVTRVGPREMTVSGTPTGEVILSLPEAAKMTKAATPKVTLSVNSDGIGVLSGIELGMIYSTDGKLWTSAQKSGEVTVNIFGDISRVFVIMRGNGEDIEDSDMLILSVPKPVETDKTDVTEPPQHDNSETKKSLIAAFGCGMWASSSTLVLLISAAACAICTKKRKDN